MDVLLDCLADENVEVREMASKVLSGIVRCSQRQIIIPLKVRLLLPSSVRKFMSCIEPFRLFGEKDHVATTERALICRVAAIPPFRHPWLVCTYREFSLFC
jgi:hypothetical protein